LKIFTFARLPLEEVHFDSVDISEEISSKVVSDFFIDALEEAKVFLEFGNTEGSKVEDESSIFREEFFM